MYNIWFLGRNKVDWGRGGSAIDVVCCLQLKHWQAVLSVLSRVVELVLISVHELNFKLKQHKFWVPVLPEM